MIVTDYSSIAFDAAYLKTPIVYYQMVVNASMLDNFEEKDMLDKVAQGRKKILLHMPDGKRENNLVADIIMPGLISFLKEHTEYLLVLSNDNIRKIGEAEKNP